MKTNSTVLIAGGTSGIGYSTAKLLIQKGAKVIITGRDQEKLKNALKELGGNASGEILDSTDVNALKQFMKSIGTLDHLVITISGRKGMGIFNDLDLSVLKEGFELKFFPQLYTAQAALPYISKNGSITFVTAVSAQAKRAGTSGLAAINGALELMVPILAKELQPLRINAVSPGVIDTAWWDFLPGEAKEQMYKEVIQGTPVGRIGKSEDIAEVINLLINHTFITGQTIVADGGLSL